MSLSVKVSFVNKNRTTRKEDVSEIRRFSIAEDAVANYDYLRAKIVNVMPLLENQAFRLYWKDNENDLIAFSSDDELLGALEHITHHGDGVFRIFARLVNDEPAPPHNCGRMTADQGVFPPFHLFQAAASAYEPWIRSFLPAAAQCCSHEPKTTNNTQSTENQKPAADIPAQPAAEDNSAHTSTGGKCPGASNDTPAGCGGQHSGNIANTMAGDYPANFITGLLNAFGLSNLQTNNEHTASNEKQTNNCKRANDVTGSSPTHDANDEEMPSDEPSKNAEATNEKETPGALSDGLIQVVESLKEMGFNDDNGWLTRFVATHSGQIERVLEVVQAITAPR